MTMQKTTSTITPTLIPTLMLTGFTVLSGLVLSSSIVSADDDSTVDEVNITVPVSCTLSGTGQNSHNAVINNGTYDSAIGETTIKAFCNDNEGFAIYAIGYTDNEDGKNVLTNATLGSTHDIVTGTAISGTDSNWAMKIGTITSPTPTYPIIIAGSNDDTEKEQGDPDYSTFQEVPDDYAKVAYRTSSTDIGTNAEGATITTTYQAYISKTQPAGTYTGQVKYTLVHPHDAARPQKPLACNPLGTTISTITCMQDINSTNRSSILASMIEDAEYQLYDMRDEKQYYIAKLKDGNIWMTQNLDHDIRTDFAYTPSNTDIPDDWTPDKSTYPTGSTAWDDSDTGDHIQQSYDPGELYWNGATPSDPSSCSEMGGTWYDEAYGCFDISTIPSIGDPHHHLGNYYSWTAALAMNDSSSIPGDGAIVHQSICPAGWTLPTTTSYYIENPENGSFQYLLQQYGWNRNSLKLDEEYEVYGAPLYYVYGGVISDSLGFVGSKVYYWSSAAVRSSMALSMATSNIDQLYPNGQFTSPRAGIPIRCLLKTN